MKSNYLLLITFIFITICGNSQEIEQQNWSLGKTYKTILDLKVNYIDGANVKQRIAKAGLKYKYIETINNLVYIKFLEITSDIPTTKGNDNYVNSDNDEITYYVPVENLNDFNKQKTLRLVSGTLVAPIKIRLEQTVNGVTVPWELSTDITLGQYIGLRIPVSKRNPYYITVPTLTLGTSLLSINSSNTDPESEATTTLGLTWSTGVVLDLNGFNIGFLLGKDYAPGEIGKDWIYNEKTWFSIGFGINLTSRNRDL